MKNRIQYVKGKLMESINSLESLKGMYVRHADKDFTRTRELPFSTMIKLILEMEGIILIYFLADVHLSFCRAVKKRR